MPNKQRLSLSLIRTLLSQLEWVSSIEDIAWKKLNY